MHLKNAGKQGRTGQTHGGIKTRRRWSGFSDCRAVERKSGPRWKLWGKACQGWKLYGSKMKIMWDPYIIPFHWNFYPGPPSCDPWKILLFTRLLSDLSGCQGSLWSDEPLKMKKNVPSCYWWKIWSIIHEYWLPRHSGADRFTTDVPIGMFNICLEVAGFSSY